MKLVNYVFPLVVFLVVLTFCSVDGFSQNGTIRGFVYEKETGEPVIFTNVYLKGTTHGAATDVNGYFAISQIPPGDYILLVTYLGFDSLIMNVSVGPNEIISKNLFLDQASYMLQQFQVSAEREEARSEGL